MRIADLENQLWNQSYRTGSGQERDHWRPGVLTRMRIPAETGAASRRVFQRWCAPTHLHRIEEILSVLAHKPIYGSERNAPR